MRRLVIFQWVLGLFALLILGGTLTGIQWSFPMELSEVQAWWFAMVGVGAIVVAASIRGEWRVSGFISASILIGYSSQLALTQPRWFPSLHLRPESSFEYLPCLGLLLQAAIFLTAVFRLFNFREAIRIVQRMGLVRALLFGSLMAACSVSAMSFIGSEDFMGYAKELLKVGGLWALHLGSAIVLAASLPRRALERIGESVTRQIGSNDLQPNPIDRLFPRAVALAVLLLTVLVNRVAFDGMPHLQDEIVYLFQAKCLLQGSVSVPAPPPSAIEALNVYLLEVVDNRWYSVTFPGWPLILAGGVALGVPWLVNPVLAALCILLAHSVFRQVADRKTANLIILLLGFSPWFIATSASMMVHTLTLFCVLAAWAALLKARQERSALLGLCAGAAMGIFFLTRPYEAAIFGTIMGVSTLRWLGQTKGWQIVIGYGVGCIAVGGVLLLFNAHFTGSLLTTPINEYADELWGPGANRIGFGPDIGPNPPWGTVDVLPGHSPVEGLINAQNSMQSLNVELFGWGIGSLSIVVALILWGRPTRFDLCFLGLAGATVVAYFPYWFTGTFYIGPRYWFMALLPLTVVTATGLMSLARKLEDASPGLAAKWRLAAVFAILGAISLGSFLSWRTLTRYKGFRGHHSGYRELVREHGLENGLVFVKTSNERDFDSAFVLNSPKLSGPKPIFVRDLGPEKNEATSAAFAGRQLYYVDGASGETEGVQITQGPNPKK